MVEGKQRDSKRRVAVALVVIAVSAWPGMAVAQERAAGDISEGARVYGDMCGRCHNPRSPLERSDRAWVTIANHMRVRGNLTGGQVRDVLAFLQATNRDPRERARLPETGARPREEETTPLDLGDVATDPATIARGEVLVEQKACLGCHVIGNSGGQVGPKLNGVVQRKGADYVRRKLGDPTFDNATSMMPNFDLNLEEIEAIVAFLNTLDGRK